MGVQRLHNADWGFESNCFVCEPRNSVGLRIPFDHDRDIGCVTAEFTLDDRFSGAPKFVHGGIVLAILDQAVAYIDCELRHEIDLGNHTLFLGEIVDVAFQKGEDTEVLRMEDTRMNYGG